MNRFESIGEGSPKVILAESSRPDSAFEISPNRNRLPRLRKRPGYTIGVHQGERQASATDPEVVVLPRRYGELVFSRGRNFQLRYHIPPKLIQARIRPDPKTALPVHKELPYDIGTKSLRKGEVLAFRRIDTHVDWYLSHAGNTLI